ncbi:pimeloyl-CoA dehydrogenase small subunit [Solimonas sp. K1W22B-7]|uniref:acyl-CoA dehydrogenase family protein n=1 Tax=Solimonas sp. K1W22B-7 TaxID=2303331 RepID=UPI000E330062|nr:acyl-CoA dehydrogenase family protein [Solimonas sp. K1W22B-7]AXQ28160.1 pimeloyl-CoA dehydrogenase small subunit [Solimonas sp. K1W22B-7]
MNFNFSEEQQQLRDTLDRYVRKDYGFEKRRGIIHSTEGWSREVWAQLADLGVLSVGLPEEHGGLGGGPFDTLLVMESLGRGMVVEPYVATVVLCAGLVARAGSEAQQAALLPGVASGETRLALAHHERGGRYDLSRIETAARRDGDAWVLNGHKSVVLHGAAADQLLVSAKTAAGISLFLVDAKAPGVSRRDTPAQDGHRVAEVTLKDVRVGSDALVGAEGAALPQIELALDHAIAALCAEAVGAMGSLIEATVTYLKTRKQFGVPIGSFQALQHRAVEMYLHAEQARSMSYLAADKLGATDPAERRRAISGAKVLVGNAARYVGQQAVQLHGGIGVTDELAVGHYFKRLTMITLLFGDVDHHVAQFGEAMTA